MAFGGYPNELKEPPLPDLQWECMVCLQVVRDPHMVSCCSLRFCRTCIERVQRQGKPCPHCQEESYTITRDSQLERVLQFKYVFCVNKKKGCEWVGELRDAERHVRDDCMWAEVDCPNKCGQQILRCKLDQHETEECPRRARPCEFADMGCKSGRLTPNRLQSHLQESMQTHLMLVCKKLREERSVRITHQTELKDLEAKVHECETEMSELNIQAKTSEEQRKELKTKVQACEKERKELKTTVQASAVERKELRSKVQACEKERKELKTTVQAYAVERKELKTKTETSEMERNELRRRVEASEVEGKELKTTVQVCEMEVRKVAEEAKKNKKCLHTLLGIMLLYAAVFGINVHVYPLLNSEVSSTTGYLETECQLKLQKLAMNVSTFNETQQAAADRWQREKEAFIHTIQTLNATRQTQIEELQRNLLNNVVHFRSKLQQLETQFENQHKGAPAIHDQTTSEQFRTLSLALNEFARKPILIPPHEIIMEKFEQHMKNNSPWFSSSFYTHIGGYKMCLKVYANGSMLGKDTHVGVGIVMMRGEFDDYLQWPFKGEVKVQLINQKEGGDNIEKLVVSENDNTKKLHRVLEGDRAVKGWGVPTFIAHSELYKPKMHKQYLRNDTLKFKIVTVTVKSTADSASGKMHKHMDDELAIQMDRIQTLSLALNEIAPQPIFIPPPEIVFESFEQHKSKGDRWFSPSFYTHIGGYKMCLSIYASGWGDGKDTHVGVAFFMMRGEYDDHLQWPFTGVLTVQLINQREGEDNLERKIKITNAMNVLEGDGVRSGRGWGDIIAHSDLYKPNEGKEYLKKDTLKFKVIEVTVKSTAAKAHKSFWNLFS